MCVGLFLIHGLLNVVIQMCITFLWYVYTFYFFVMISTKENKNMSTHIELYNFSIDEQFRADKPPVQLITAALKIAKRQALKNADVAFKGGVASGRYGKHFAKKAGLPTLSEALWILTKKPSKILVSLQGQN